MTELPYLGLRPNMFQGALQCPSCGFATSDDKLYECPACQMVWRQRPKAVQVNAGPQTGEAVSLSCLLCGESVTDGRKVVFAGGSDLAHEDCLKPEPTVQEIPPELSAYAKVIEQAPQKPKRKRKRKRKPRPQSSNTPNTQTPPEP